MWAKLKLVSALKIKIKIYSSVIYLTLLCEVSFLPHKKAHYKREAFKLEPLHLQESKYNIYCNEMNISFGD